MHQLENIINTNTKQVNLAKSFLAIEELSARVAELENALTFVERWANHHGRTHHTAEEILSCIQHYPEIEDITKRYADGVIPDTRNPYAELEFFQKRVAELEKDGARLDWLNSQAHKRHFYSGIRYCFEFSAKSSDVRNAIDEYIANGDKP